jgi:oxygen-independent coproporphyrinogen-3 oxidase
LSSADTLKAKRVIDSLYIHIPFCVKKCIYCDFFSIPYDEGLALRYVDAVVRELALRKTDAGELRTIYVGGGTPTTLPLVSLIRVFKAIRDTFAVTPSAEVTVEANPGTVDRDKVRALAHMGVNRFSLGVQSFDDDTLKLLGRVHTFEDILRVVAAVGDSPIENFSIDLIYGIPGQTAGSWERTVSTAIELAPHHISAYELTPEKGTPLQDMIAQGKLTKPDEETIIEMYSHTIDRLAEAGYRHYEISNFARPGFECRHNLNYWERGRYLGIGAGAHGFVDDMRMKNTSDLKRYMDDLKAGKLPVEESMQVSREEAIKEFIFLGLRKTEGLDIEELREGLGIDILTAGKELMAGGLLVSDSTHLRLTRRGLVVSNAVIAELLEALKL